MRSCQRLSSKLKYHINWYSGRQMSYSNIISKDLLNKYQSSLHSLLEETFAKQLCLQSSGIVDHIKRTADYYGAGSNFGGIMMLHAYDMLGKPEYKTDDGYHQACVLAWAIEMINSYNVVLQNSEMPDEIAKRVICSTTQINSINDASLLHSFASTMLDEYFIKHTAYKDFIQLYNKGYFLTAIGKYFHSTCKGKANKYAGFNLKQYEMLCSYTGYCNFKLPFFLAMEFTNRNDNTLYKEMDQIGSDFSILHQMQEDYHDCFGAPNKGYTGTDIQTGKCTWLATVALQRCTSAQRVVFETCYGSNEPAHYERIKRLYEQLDLPRICKEHKDSIFEKIEKQAKALEGNNVPSELFFTLLDALRGN